MLMVGWWRPKNNTTAWCVLKNGPFPAIYVPVAYHVLHRVRRSLFLSSMQTDRQAGSSNATTTAYYNIAVAGAEGPAQLREAGYVVREFHQIRGGGLL